MRTKHILAALALPALFAACTNDEFEGIQNPNVDNSVLKGRASGHITVTATKGDAEAETRVIGDLDGNTLRWMWEGKGDKLGATVVDYGVNNAIVDMSSYPAYAITNYPFAPDIDGPAYGANFSTPGAVVEGAYIFYNQYNGEITKRRVIGHEIDRLTKVKYGREAGVNQVGTKEHDGQNFFISPIVDLAIKDGSSIAKPISMKSVYSVFHFVLNTDLKGGYYDKGFKVNKIVLETVGDGSEFKRKLELNPAALAKVQQGLITPATKHLFKDNGAINAMGLDNDGVSEALKLVNDKLADPTANIGTASNGTKDLVFQLENPYTFKSAEDVMELLVIVPAGVYNRKTGLAEYNGGSAGEFKMTVYTSEGTYTNYIDNGAASMTLERGNKYRVKRTMIIDGGRTNVNLFDPNAGFNVETKEDYNYVIEYINEHYRDFGNNSDWKTPVLNFKEGVAIEVDAEHYFPEFPVKYLGDATLKLVCKNHNYTFDPENVILGQDAKGKGRPTIEVVSETSSIKFNKNVEAVEGKKDGEHITAAVKLISAGNVEVAEGKTVNFELLTSKKQLDINKGAVVNVFGAAVTNGVVNVKEGSRLNANETFANAAEMTIEAKAVATLSKASTNEGKITIKGLGELAAKGAFTNKVAGEIVVENCDLQYMNSDERAKAEFTTIENAGKITVLASVDKKGTYGGWVNVATKLTNTGEVFNNGEMKIKNVANGGTITLQEDPYALLKIEGGTLTNAKGEGSVVLAAPTQYEMFDNYYTGNNSLSAVKNNGVIETTLDQAAYNDVMKNYKKYNEQERAWEVLNKITITGNLDLESTETAGKDFVLPANASINAVSNLTVNSLTTVGAATGLKAVKSNTVVTVNKTVLAGGELTVDKNVKLLIHSQSTTMLNVTGKLINNGWIDTNDSEGDEPNMINTLVSGELVNNGKLSKKPTAKYSGSGYNNVKILINALRNSTTDFKGKWGVNIPRVDYFSDTTEPSSWNNESAWGNIKGVTTTVLTNILTKGTVSMIGGYQAIVWKSGRKYYALYLGQAQNVEKLGNDENFEAARANSDLVGTAIKVANGDKMPEPRKTWFYVTKNTGTIDLLKAADDKQSWAYGEIFDNTRGTKKGKFNNEMQ